MFPSCRTLLRFVISWIALLEISYLQGRPVNSTAKNFALFQHIEASSSCGLEGSEVFCLPGNDTVCETCDATCPSGRRLPFVFVDLVSEGTVHQVSLVDSCREGRAQNKSALKFYSAPGYVSSPISAPSSEGWTFSAWIKQDTGNKGYVSIASNSSAVQLLLLVDNTLGELALHRRNTSTNVTTELVRAANVSLSGSGCHHVAVTCHGSTLHVFVEGQFVGQASMGEDVTLNGVLLLSNGYGLNRSSFFEGEITSPRLYYGALLKSDISELSGKPTRQPRLLPMCRCPLDHPALSSQDDNLCVDVKTNRTVPRINIKSHLPGRANDGNLTTWWQSSNSESPVDLSLSLGGVKQVLQVEVRFQLSPPKSVVLLKSADNGTTWTPLQYFSRDCQEAFNLSRNGLLEKADGVKCDERFSNATLEFSLLDESRPGSGDFEENSTLWRWALATHLRLHVTSFHGNVSEKSAFVAVAEFAVFGRDCDCSGGENDANCSCNGTLIRGECDQRIWFDNAFYERRVTNETPEGGEILQVRARKRCPDGTRIVYSITNGNANKTFGINNVTGVVRTFRPLPETAAYRLHILAEDNDGDQAANASVDAMIKVSPPKDPSEYTNLNFLVQGLGFMQDQPRINEAKFGLFVNNHPDFEGRLVASVGAVSSQASFQASRTPAVSVRAVLLDADVWLDNPVVRVLAQVQDPSHSVRTLVERSHVGFGVVPGKELADLRCGNVQQITSVPSPTTGLCEVHIPLPSCWFTDPAIAGPQEVTVKYDLLSSSDLLGVTLATVTLHPEKEVQLHQDDVYAVLPSRPINIGDIFRFHVYADSSFAIASYGLKLSTNSCLEIIAVDVDASKWLHVAVRNSSSLWAVSGSLSNPEAAPIGYVRGERLLSFDVKVNDSATERFTTLELEVSYLSNINNEEVRIGAGALPSQAAMIGGSNTARDTIGRIHIRRNYITGLLPFAEPSELVNTAALNGEEVSTTITLFAVRESGEKIFLPSARCFSRSGILHVRRDCSRVWLNGSESAAGSAAAVVTVLYGNLSANVSLRVWHPVLPLKLSVENPRLGKVADWFAPDENQAKCVQMYQWTEIQARANFTYDGSHAVEVTVTEFLSNLFESSDRSVVHVTDDGVVSGKSSGKARISALNPATRDTLGSVDVTVDNEDGVNVHSIDVSMVTNLTVDVAPSPYAKDSTQTATVQIEQEVNRDLSRSSVVVYATFSDGTQQQLRKEQGLKLTSLNRQVLHVDDEDNSEVLTVSSGSSGVKAKWRLTRSVCYPEGFLLGVGYDVVDVDLSRPARVIITNVSRQITIPGDISTTAGIPTSSWINIELLFENKDSTDMTADARTILDESQSQGFFHIKRDDQNRPIIYGNSDGKRGKKNLIVRFTHFDITASVEINIVGFLALALHMNPFPSFPGSKNVFLRTLNPIEGVDQYEMGSLCLKLVMSDESEFDVTHHNLARFFSSSNALVVGEKAPNQVLVRNGMSASDSYYVEGRFEGEKAMHLISLGSNPVRVAAIANVTLDPENNSTLSGAQNTHAARVKFSLLFDNGKQAPDFYQDGVALFAGLVTITSENEQVFTVDANTGLVTLRLNYHRPLALTVTAAESQAQAEIKVLCNLRPDDFDVDLGSENGLPLAPQNVGSVFEVPVRLNAGRAEGTTKMDLFLVYDRRFLEAVSVRVHRVWSNVVTNWNEGEITINAVCDLGPLRNTLEVAVVTFNATGAGLASVVGSVTTDEVTNRPIVSGMLLQEVYAVRGRRRRNTVRVHDPFAVEFAKRVRRTSPCATPRECDKCKGMLGDLNRDCVFDISDILFVLTTYTRSLLALPTPAVAMAIPPAELDVDQNSAVEPADAYFLIRANLGLVRFILNTAVRPVQNAGSDCKLSLNVTLATKSGPARPSNTFVFFDLTYKGERVEFSGAEATLRGPGIYGLVVQAVTEGGGVFSVASPIELYEHVVGVSIYHVTTNSENGTNMVRTFPMFGSANKPRQFPITLSLSLQVAGKGVFIQPSIYNPFIVFNNTLASSTCRNDFGPIFSKERYSAHVVEDAANGTTVLCVNATDQDVGKSGDVTHSVVSLDVVPFAIDPASGRIFINGRLDREERDSYNFTVRASDGALGRARYAHAHVTIIVDDVNDNPPVITDVIPGNVTNVSENAKIGDVLATVVASDPDINENGRVIFQLSTSTEIFLINSTTGQVTLRNLLHGRVGERFALEIFVQDHGVSSLNSSVSIEFLITYARDVRVLFPKQIYRGNVTENSPVNTTIIQVSAHIPEFPQAVLQYFIDDDALITVGRFDGAICVGSKLDREETPHINRTVSAAYGDKTTSVTLWIEVTDVNDVRPSFEKSVYTLELNEGTSPVSFVEIFATDTDDGPNGFVTYSIISGNESIFHLNQTSGIVSILEEVDYESVQQLNFTVEAKDHGEPPLNSSALFIVNIRDVNDNYPVIETPNRLTIREDQKPGWFVVKVNATDSDSGLNSKLLFTLTSGNTGSAFTINSTTGVITTANSLDYEKNSFYSLEMSVQDQGSPPFRSSAVVKVDVLDVNDVIPVIESPSRVHVRENTPVGTVIGRLNASDADSGDNAVLGFSIVEGNDRGLFRLNSTSGELTLSGILDHENASEHSLTVNVSDSGLPSLSSTSIIQIYVVDINDHRPIFDQESYETSILENMTVGSIFLHVSAFDLDSGADQGILFAITAGNLNHTFEMNASTGAVSIAKPLDYEVTRVYRLVVEANDTFVFNDSIDSVGGGNSNAGSSVSFFSYANLTVHILDANDNTPYFQPAEYFVTIRENLAPGESIAQVHAFDGDADANGEVGFYLISGDGLCLFAINQTSGEISTKAYLTDANYLNFTLQIQAEDQGLPALSSVAKVRLRIEYNVTFRKERVSPFTFFFDGTLAFGEPEPLSRQSIQLELGLFHSSRGLLKTRVGRLERTTPLTPARTQTAILRAVVLRAWPDYRSVGLAVQVSEEFLTPATADHVYFELRNVRRNETVHFSCTPAIHSRLCIASADLPESWLNLTSSNDTVLISYGTSPWNPAELDGFVVTKTKAPEFKRGNFLLTVPAYRFQVGDAFTLEGYGHFEDPIVSYILLCRTSGGFQIVGAHGREDWAVFFTPNGPHEFAIFGVRDSRNSFVHGSAEARLYLTLTMNATEASSGKPGDLSCDVNFVGSVVGNPIIPRGQNVQKRALIWDRFGVSDIGRLWAEGDQVKAIFAHADRYVLINTAVLNGHQVEVSLEVTQVTAQGKVANATAPTCQTMAPDALKVSSNCTNVFLDGSETSGSTNAVILIQQNNMTANISFTVWLPVTPLRLDASQGKLNRVQEWLDPKDSCRPRYQQARLRAFANISNGEHTKPDADVTHLILQNLRSLNASVAGIEHGLVKGQNEGQTTVDVYIPKFDRVIGSTVISITDRSVRVYVVDIFVASRVTLSWSELSGKKDSYLVNVTAEEKFLRPAEEGSLLVSLQYSDGEVNTFENLDGFLVKSLDSNGISVQHGILKPSRSGDVQVTVYSGNCSEKNVASGTGLVDVSFVEPVEIEALVSSRFLTYPGDPAESLGIPALVRVKAQLMYNVSDDIEYYDISNDASTIVDITSGYGTVDRSDGISIHVSSNTSGEVHLTIGHPITERRTSIILDIVVSEELRILANPYPGFDNSEQTNVTQLRPVGVSGEHQKVMLRLLVVLSNGSVVDVSQAPAANFSIRSTHPRELAQNVKIRLYLDGHYVLEVVRFSSAGNVSLCGLFVGFVSQVLNLRIGMSALTVASLEIALPANFTLEGVRGKSTVPLSVDVEFNDGSKLVKQVKNENLWNEITLTTQDIEKISLNSTNGLVTLTGNSYRDVTVTASVIGSSVSAHAHFACNLQPEVGDVDVGDANGVPLKARRVGETFTVAVWVNAGSAALGSFHIELSYQAELLQVTKVEKGRHLVGLVQSNVKPGGAYLAGALFTTSVQSSPVHIATLTLRGASSGIGHLSGRILMLADDSLLGVHIGPTPPRDIVAGDVEIEIAGEEGRARREAPLGRKAVLSREKRAGPTTCPTPPCSVCPSGREDGDTDWNCVFDIRDVRFMLTYLTEKQFNFSTPKGKEISKTLNPTQLQALDADGDGVVSFEDADRLLRARLNLVSLFPSLEVVPIQDRNSKCLLGISVPAGDLGAENENETNVFFQISHRRINFSSELQEDQVIIGEHFSKTAFSGILLARFNKASDTYEVALNTSLVLRDIGVSVIRVGLVDRRLSQFYGKSTKSPHYPEEFNLTLDLGNEQRYSVNRPRGYNPLITFNNTLASNNCSDEPLLAKTLSEVQVWDARTIFISWTLKNIRKDLNFPFVLDVTECDLLQAGNLCRGFQVNVSGASHILRNLKPFSNYSVKIESRIPPPKSTTWKTVRTWEAAPEGVRPPVIQVLSYASVNVLWSIPDQPNGVITNYSLLINNGTGYRLKCQGIELSCGVSGLTPGRSYQFYVVANTSAGGTRSTEVTVEMPLPMQRPVSSGRQATLPDAASVGIALGAAFVLLLLVVFFLKWKSYREERKLEEYRKTYHFLDKYNYVDVKGRENVQLRAKAPVRLQRAPHLKRGVYEIQTLSVDGLESTWPRHYDNEGFVEDKGHQSDVDTHQQPSSAGGSAEGTPREYYESISANDTKEHTDQEIYAESNCSTLPMAERVRDDTENSAPGQQEKPSRDVQIGRQTGAEHFDEIENTIQVTQL